MSESSADAHAWTVVRLPAFAEEDDPIGRSVGEPLWPGRVTKSDLDERRKLMGQRAFESQFQQSPLSATGDIIKSEWLEHTYSRVPEGLSVLLALDAAAKTGIANDHTALVVVGSSKNEHYVLDVQRRKVDFPGLTRMLLTAYEKHHPTTIVIEDTSNAVALIQQLKRETTLPIVGVTPKGSKLSRVDAITGTLEAGKVLLPDERKVSAPWLLDFRKELLGFPNAKHDDQVDAFALALSRAATENTRGWILFGSLAMDFNGDDLPDHPEASATIPCPPEARSRAEHLGFFA